MTGQTPEQRIAEVQRAHQQADEYGYDIEECRCGTTFEGDYAAHVAAEIVRALGLTEERLPVHPRTNAKPCDNCGHLKGVHAEPCRISDFRGRSCGCAEYRYTPPSQSWKCRYVTAWEAV